MICGRYKTFFSSPEYLNWLWGPPSLLLEGDDSINYLQLKRTGHESDRSYPPSSGVKNEQGYTSRPPYAFMVCKQTTVPFIPLSFKWSPNSVHISHVFHTRCIPTHHTILTICNEQYILSSTTLFSFLQPPVISSLLAPNMFISKLFQYRAIISSNNHGLPLPVGLCCIDIAHSGRTGKGQVSDGTTTYVVQTNQINDCQLIKDSVPWPQYIQIHTRVQG